MATKPTSHFTWATDANFLSGDASGNPTKVNATGWPAVGQGFVPGTAVAAELVNKPLNVLGDWTGWLLAGSSTGAADAHIVETDSSGNARVRRLDLTADEVQGVGSGGSMKVSVEKEGGTGGNDGRGVTLQAAQGQDTTGSSRGGDIFNLPGVRGGDVPGEFGEVRTRWKDGDDDGEVGDFFRRYEATTGSGTYTIDSNRYQLVDGEAIIFDLAVAYEPAGGGTKQIWRGSAAIQRNGGTTSILDAGTAVISTGTVAFVLNNISNAAALQVTFPGNGVATVIGRAHRMTPNA